MHQWCLVALLMRLIVSGRTRNIGRIAPYGDQRLQDSMLTMLSVPARADDIVVYAAGSLRESIERITNEFAQAHSLGVTT
jgi:ABC-type molybdate transport system substrate-binding protein